MRSLVRSVITQATRGGRCVVPRRNFCSPPVSQEAKGAAERIALAIEALERVRQKYYGPVVVMAMGYVSAYFNSRKTSAELKVEIKNRIEQYQREYVAKSSQLPTEDN